MSRRCLPLISVLLFTQYSFLNLFNTISSLEELILVCRTSFEFLRFSQICFSSAGIATFSYMRTSDCCLTARSFNVTDLIDLMSILKKVRVICVCLVLEYSSRLHNCYSLRDSLGLLPLLATIAMFTGIYRELMRYLSLFKYGQKSL